MIESDQIERDEADFVTPSDYSCYESGSAYLPVYWFSKYPAKSAPTWNLLKVFDPPSWTLIFTSIICVTIFFFIVARIGTFHFGIQTVYEEIVLSPFRQILDP